MAELDVAAKVLLRVEPGALLQLALPQARIVSVSGEETELAAQSLLMDKLFRLELAGEAEPRWQHVEVEAAWASSVPREVFDYWSRASQGFAPLRSFVLVLKPGEKQGRPRGEYAVDDGPERLLTFRFDVVCAWDLDAGDILRAGSPGLLPLLPFARGATEELVNDALRQLDRLQPRSRRAELLGALAAFAGNVYPETHWLGRIPKEILMESTVYQEIKAEGRAEGKAEGRAEGKAEGQVETLLVLLRVRLGASAETYTERLKAASPAQLTEAARTVALVGESGPLQAALDRLLPP